MGLFHWTTDQFSSIEAFFHQINSHPRQQQFKVTRGKNEIELINKPSRQTIDCNYKYNKGK